MVSVRVFDCNGSGSSSGVIAGIDWVITNMRGPAVANFSLGGDVSEMLNSAVRNLIRAGVQVSVSAGNDNGDACRKSPASTLEAVTVGATGNTDTRRVSSNWGNCIDLFAPGAAITSASHLDATSSALKSGTSMAAPHVAGVMALWLHENPALTPAQLHQMIVSNATQNVVKDAQSTNAHLLHSVRGPAAAPSPPPNAAPIASFTASCTDLTCSVDASASTDSDGSIARYDWTFGDGSVGSGRTMSRSYAAAGSYTVTLTVTDDRGATSTRSSTVSPTDPAPPATTVAAPAAPTNLRLKLAANRVDLSWSDRSSKEEGFEIQRRTGSGAWVTLARTRANTTAYSDATVQVGQSYGYRVRAFNTGGESGFSNEATITVTCTAKGKNSSCP